MGVEVLRGLAKVERGKVKQEKAQYKQHQQTDRNVRSIHCANKLHTAKVK